ncbi:hypothetical protein GIB67_032807 [Kingdonia uniflora]|uniref:Uncharacterized protein n=1 Tax=Kingdonia uniflora TaxID=39325 RepID=A0A7J7MWP4_9MAGN|nr:hypothetical protein GIB67_032807 [Kingdonia uniflora]
MDNCFSNLQDDLLHMIVSRLPTIEDAISTSTISKRWRYSWKSIDKLVFSENQFNDKQRFNYFINQTLKLHNPCFSLNKFAIILKGYGELPYEIEQWIDSALRRNVQNLHLAYCSKKVDDIYGDVKLVSLKSMMLNWVVVTNEALMHLLAGSPVIETLHLHQCKASLSLEGHHTSLNYIMIRNCVDFEIFDMDVPNLHFFRYDGLKERFEIKRRGVCSLRSAEIIYIEALILSCWGFLNSSFTVSPALKRLILINFSTTHEIIQSLFSNCRQLENLVLVGCSMPNYLKICCEKLRHLEINRCCKLQEIEIDAPNLVSFKYLGGMVDISPMNSTCTSEVTLRMESYSQSLNWRNIFEKFSQISSLTLSCGRVEECLLLLNSMEKLHSSLPFFSHLKYLEFEAWETSLSLTDILVPLLGFSAYLERVEILKLVVGFFTVCVKFQAVKSMDLVDLPSINWTRLPLVYLQRHFKEVDISNISRKKNEMELVRFLLGDVMDLASTSNITLTKPRVVETEEEKKKKGIKVNKVTLEEWLLSSPGMKHYRINGGELHVFKQSSRVFPPKQANSLFKESLLKVDEVDLVVSPSLSRSRSGRLKKSVIFRLPEEADIILIYSP